MPTDPSDIYAGYQRASRIAPVEKDTILTALKPYGIGLARLRNRSDAELRTLAATAVLARWRSRQPTAR